MAEAIHVVRTGFGKTDWRAEFAESGSYICDIRIQLSLMLNGSRYYVLRDGKVVKDGSFNFDTWTEETERDLLTGIVRSMYPEATVTIDLARPRSSA